MRGAKRKEAPPAEVTSALENGGCLSLCFRFTLRWLLNRVFHNWLVVWMLKVWVQSAELLLLRAWELQPVPVPAPQPSSVQGGTGLCFRGFPGNPKGTSDICKRLGLRLLVLFEYPVRLTQDESREPQEVLRKGCLISQTSPPRTAPLSRALLAKPQIKAETDFSAAWSLSFSIMLKYSRVCHSAVCHKQPTTVHDWSINIHVWCSNSDSFELSISKEQIETFLNFLCSVNHSLACQS